MHTKQVERYSFPNLYFISLENVRNIPENFKIDDRNNFYENRGIVSTAIGWTSANMGFVEVEQTE